MERVVTMHRTRTVTICFAATFLFTNPLRVSAEDARAVDLFSGTKYAIHSEILGDQRSFVVHLPEGYASTTVSYPVLYVLDGEYFHHMAYASLQFLAECGYIRNHPVPQMILVTILDVDRNRDFTPTHAPVQGTARFPTSGGARDYLRHLEEELLPYIDEHYRTHPHRVLTGWSLGGLFTIHAFLERRDLFSTYIAISPSMWWDDQYPVAKANAAILQAEKLVQRLVITQGTKEVGGIPSSVKNGIVQLLRDKSTEGWKFIEIPDEVHSIVPYKALYAGLTEAYDDYALTQEVIDGGTESVRSHYARLSERYGYQVAMPGDAYYQIVASRFASRNPSEILPVTEEWTRAYPYMARAWYYRGRLFQKLGSFEEARTCFQKARGLELGKPLPDSEWLMPIVTRLEEVEMELR
jgi:predicted alpha/beta superfamily hydrolase